MIFFLRWVFRVCSLFLFLFLVWLALFPKQTAVGLIEWQVDRYFTNTYGLNFHTENRVWKEGKLYFRRGSLSNGQGYLATFEEAIFTPKLSIRERVFGGKLFISSVDVQKFTFEPIPLTSRFVKRRRPIILDLELSISTARFHRDGKTPLTLELSQKIKGKSFEGNLSLNWDHTCPEMRTSFSYDETLDQHMIATHFSGHTLQDFYETIATIFPHHLPPHMDKWKANGGALFGSLQATFAGGELTRIVTDLDLKNFEGENIPLQIRLAAKRIGIQLNLDCTSLDRVIDWQGKFELETGSLSFRPFRDEMWDAPWEFQDLHSSVVVEDGTFHHSKMSGKFMGMEGELVLLPSGDELFSLKFSGNGNEMTPFIPQAFRERFHTLFEKDLFRIAARCAMSDEGLSMEGELKHLDEFQPHSLRFGCLFRESENISSSLFTPQILGLSKQVKHFVNELGEQFHNTHKRLGWFKAENFLLEKYLSPFFFESLPYSIEGVTTVEGSFDENHLVIFYSGDNLAFKGRDFVLELHRLETSQESKISAVHCFDLVKKTHSGFLPIENATYNYHKKNLTFTNCKAIAYFKHNKIEFKGMEGHFDDLIFKGEALFDLENPARVEVTYRFPSIEGEYQTAKRLYEATYQKVLPAIDLTGKVKTRETGMELKYIFESQRAILVESSLFGNFDLAYRGKSLNLSSLKGDFSHAYPNGCFSLGNIEGDIVAFQVPYHVSCPLFTFGSEKRGEIFLEQENQRILDLMLETTKDSYFFEGSWRSQPLSCRALVDENNVLHARALLGLWEGMLDCDLLASPWNLKECHFKHPQIGVFSLGGTVDLPKGEVSGEIKNLSLDIGEMLCDQNPLWDTKGEIYGRGEFRWKKGLGAKIWISHKNLAISGLRFADGEHLECSFVEGRGVTVNGLKALIPLREGEEHYDLGKFVYDPYRGRMFFDRFSFALPLHRTSWIASVYEQLLDTSLDPSLLSFVSTVKNEEILRGVMSAEFSPQNHRFYLNLEDGMYQLFGLECPLKNTRICFRDKKMYIESEFNGLETPLHVAVRAPENLSFGEILIKDPLEVEVDPLVFRWENKPQRGIDITSVAGKLFGMQMNLLLKEGRDKEMLYHGQIELNPKKTALYFEKNIGQMLHIMPSGNFSLEGEWLLDRAAKRVGQFTGVVIGDHCTLLGTHFDSFNSFVEITKDGVRLEGTQLEDWSGDLTIPEITLHRKEKEWYFDAQTVLLTNFRLSRLNSHVVNPKRSRPLCRSIYIPRFELNQFRGKVNNPLSYQGSGELLFTNFTRKNILTNMLMIPTEISARLGLDLTNFIPARGKIHFELDKGHFRLTDFEDVYSEGKRSKFLLEENSVGFIDFSGNIHLKLKMKQYNLLMKFAELLTISVEGTLFDPLYSFESCSEF